MTGEQEQDIVLAWFNAQALTPKEELVKAEMKREGVAHCVVGETNVYKNGGFTDAEWVWNAGPEERPRYEHRSAPRGMGTFTDRDNKGAMVHTSQNLVMSRIERDKDLPLFVIACHFMHSRDMKAHRELWSRIEKLCNEAGEVGDVVLMGDFNAHTQANGDETEVDAAGRLMLRMAKKLGLTVVNQMAMCEGKHSRVVQQQDGKQVATTIDYVMVSQSLAGRVKQMKLGNQLGSDHKFVTVRLAGAAAQQEQKETMREVWKVESLPDTKVERQSFVAAFQRTMRGWLNDARHQMAAMEAVGVEARRATDILEWSFQAKLDEESSRQLGTKYVGPKASPMLDRAMRMMNDHRKNCERVLKEVMANKGSTSEERMRAVKIYREAKRELFCATKRRKEMVELETFRQIEQKQADSKLFWARAKRVTKKMRAGIVPPPMVMDDKGKVEADPIKVLARWRQFSAEIASGAPEEEGMYDDDYQREVEARLEELRRVERYQSYLDRPISDEEVFQAIRKLKMGKAPGVDGVLTSIVKTAADAVGKSKLEEGNTVVEALCLLFNYVFYKEEWPERWGSGIIFPLYKQDSRLEPGNYRPITLLSVIGKLFGSIVDKRLSDWSERTGVIADEQGGFRRNRGTIDQIFILREIISSRRERGLPTLVTYIDARKAYDTVWREGNYVRLFDLGVQGKMWRQIQTMGGSMRSKVRLTIGETEWHDVKRGVAQGAAESPWLYSNFINGMVQELKSRGLGIMIGGIRVPLLMYADDIVMLASSVTELREMNRIATQFAHQNRFRHNGAKSAVMMFNPDKRMRERVEQEVWTLSGERVEVVDNYKYLGVDVLNNIMNWKVHVARLIGKAKKRSRDLMWVCRKDEGLRPRSAMTLWKAMVRPIMEYAAELWAGEVSKEQMDEMEGVQIDFAKAMLGLTRGGVSNDFVRAEAGLETITARCEKLRLGYWRRIQVASPERALSVIARHRTEHVRWGVGKRGEWSWMKTTRKLLRERGMGDHWYDPTRCTEVPKEQWKDEVYQQVERWHDAGRANRMRGLSSMQKYLGIKHWGETDAERAEFKGEIGQRGALVFEKYLDDTGERLKPTQANVPGTMLADNAKSEQGSGGRGIWEHMFNVRKRGN